MSSRWLTVTDAAVLLRCTERDVRALIVDRALNAELVIHDYRILRTEVEAYAASLKPVSTKRPAWTPWSAADDPEARAEQADYDPGTPDDEGDDEQ
jgi:excisionase family DNA binding protein